MNFAAPFFLLGLVVAAVPVVIHLVGLRRAPRRSFAALEFILGTSRRVARRLRLRQLLLLVVRALLAAGIALMMAKPFTEAESDLPAIGGKRQSAVIVVDDSLSMRRQVDGATLFARAQTRAQQVVSLLGAQADVAVLRLSRPSLPLPSLTHDTRKVLSAINSLKPGHGHATVAPALQQAVRLLADSSLPDRHVFVLSDLAGHGWSKGVHQIVVGAQLHLMDLAKGLEPRNRAVVDLSAKPSSAPGPRSSRIVARICNYSGKSDVLKVSLIVDEKLVARGLLPLGAWTCGNKSFHHVFLRGGLHAATVSLEPDDLPEDDQRHLFVEVESPLRVLLVNGEPSPVRHRDELYYLEAALQLEGMRGRPLVTKSITPAELGQARLTTFDVVVLCNVASLPVARAADLEAFVQRGGGLLIAVGENVDPAGTNHVLQNLLPQELRTPVSTAVPGTGEGALRIGRVESDHPIFASVWSESGGGGLRAARFHRVYRLSPAARADRKVLLWYDDGSPALVESKRGQGHTLLFTSTLDRDWNDLPIRPGFLPLVQEMIRYLGREPEQTLRRSVEVDSVETVRLTRGIRQVRLFGPGGLGRFWSRSKLTGRQTVEIVVELPGLYQLSGAGSDGLMRPLERESFAANVDPREADLRQITPLDPRGQGGKGVRAKQRIELWHALGALLLALLLAESFLVRRG